MTDTQERAMEPGFHAAIGYREGETGEKVRAECAEQVWMESHHAAFAAAEHRARTTGPLWEAMKTWASEMEKAEGGYGDILKANRAYQGLMDAFKALATMEQDPKR